MLLLILGELPVSLFGSFKCQSSLLYDICKEHIHRTHQSLKVCVSRGTGKKVILAEP